jgi:phage tail sheath protein FI
MPVTPTYPGLYLEELSSNARTITAAPTSVAVFVGYTHPFKTRQFDSAVEVFSFTEYEREFGGLYSSGVFDHNVAYAVHEFFLNGGSVAYVVGLKAKYLVSPGGPTAVVAPTLTIGGLVFTTREPTDLEPMHVTVDNISGIVADLTITYGNSVETYRGASIDVNSDRFVERVIGTAANPLFPPRSALVTVGPAGGGYALPGASTTSQFPDGLPAVPPAGSLTTFDAAQFGDVFDADSSLDKVEVFNLLCVPGVSDSSVVSTALAFAERKLAFMIVDPPPNASADGMGGLPRIETLIDNVPKSTNGALYFPYLLVSDPLTSLPMELPPSGFVAGKFSASDLRRGVWKAPAGLETAIATTQGVVERGRMNDPRQGVLNPKGINVLRTFAGTGTVIFGARTLVTANLAFQQWRYVNVRRMALFIEQSLMQNLGWAVFESNDLPLWTALRTTVNDFMLGLFNQQAFQGDSPSQAFKVVCDDTTTTQADVDNGIVNILVGFRPLKPAEFVVIKIAQLAGQPQ